MSQSETPSVAPPDLPGEVYTQVLRRLHAVLSPKTYLEIGVATGDTLALSRCHSIGIDPSFDIQNTQTMKQSILHLYQMNSDDFFSLYSPTEIFGQPVDMAFLDGMHRCEFLLRDFINTEKHCKPNSVITMHDCLPVEVAMTKRNQGGAGETPLAAHRATWWTGDVWRTALLLKRKRPDIRITAFDASGTGLVALTHLNPQSTLLFDGYKDFVDEMMSYDLGKIGIDNFFSEMELTSTSILEDNSNITKMFWL